MEIAVRPELRFLCIFYGIQTYSVKNTQGQPMKEYIEERAIQIANYIIDENATVRQTAKRFGISKSTIHAVVTI